MNTNHDYIRLIKNLFKDQLRRKEIGILSEMTIIEDRMKEQWDESENAFVDPAVGEHMWNQILKKYKKGPETKSFLKTTTTSSCLHSFINYSWLLHFISVYQLH